jgi:hypothetical protein
MTAAAVKASFVSRGDGIHPFLPETIFLLQLFFFKRMPAELIK